ncbi:hypothetical protein SVIOM74S_02024 [Streptomyces violarus]
MRGHGDFTGDGRADLLARQSSTGDLYLYKATGKAGSEALSSRIKVRSAWTGYNAFDAVGDISGDGNADFLALTPGGTLYLYKGTCGESDSGAGVFFPEVAITFAVVPGEHYHVPLLLNPFGYSVYRGS